MANSPTWDRIAGNWKQFTGSIRERWGELTDDEILEMHGNREQLEGKIQERYGMAREEARRQIDRWLNDMDY